MLGFFSNFKQRNDFNQISFIKIPIYARFLIFCALIFFVDRFYYILTVFSLLITFITIFIKFLLLILGKFDEKDITLSKKIENCSNFNKLLEILSLEKEELKTYSVLIPVYKENKLTLQNLCEKIKKIKYPSDILSVFIVCEEGDFETISFVENIFCDKIFTILKAPNGFPRTKGRALNYAMNFVKSEYLCVFDAEDLPQESQLIFANYLFKNGNKNLAIIQAELEYYNRINYISEGMYIEYKQIFSIRNRFMSLFCGFFPIGGTSNHIKVSELRKIGGWNSYNVTEDAEIAMRAASFGLKISTMRLKTLEESVVDQVGYIGQRSRWIKGFMQTFSHQLLKIFTTKPTFASLKVDVFLMIYFFCTIFPQFVFILISIKVFYLFCLNINDGIFVVFDANNLIIYLAFSQIVMRLIYICLIYLIGVCDGVFFLKKSLIFYDLYLLYLTSAAYVKAVFEFVFFPYKWVKTKHLGTFIDKI